MESYNRRQERNLKIELSKVFTLAESTAEHVGLYLNKDNTARQPWDFYPGLFAEEKKAHEAAMAKEQNEKARENRRAYAAELKRRREMGLT